MSEVYGPEQMLEDELFSLRTLPEDIARGILRLSTELQFPLNSRADILAALGGANRPMSFRGKTPVPARLWVQTLPAALFPFVTKESFVEKLGEFYTAAQRPSLSAAQATAGVTRLMEEHSGAVEALLRIASTRSLR